MGTKSRFSQHVVKANPVIRHIVMWDVQGESSAVKQKNAEHLKHLFHSLRGLIPGLISLDVGIDISRIDYACDVVLFSEFESEKALIEYASHPEHLRVKEEIGNIRIARHQVDYYFEEEKV
jgi:hypothetical protein